ncbi:MAG: hypothetical protein AABZ46_01310 [Nitrospirota bacterium]
MSMLPIITRAVLLNPRNAWSGVSKRKKISERTTRTDTMSTGTISIENKITANSIISRVMTIFMSGMEGIILDNQCYFQVN